MTGNENTRASLTSCLFRLTGISDIYHDSWIQKKEGGSRMCLNSELTPLNISGLSNLCKSLANTSPNSQCLLAGRFGTVSTPCCCRLVVSCKDRGRGATLAAHPGPSSRRTEIVGRGGSGVICDKRRFLGETAGVKDVESQRRS